jgi:hypothetical protein
MTMTVGYPGKNSVDDVRKEQVPEPQKCQQWKRTRLQNTNSHPTQLTTTNKFEALRHADTEGNARHEREDPAPTPIFVPPITNMQWLTATTEQVVRESEPSHLKSKIIYRNARDVKRTSHQGVLCTQTKNTEQCTLQKTNQQHTSL